MVLSLALSGEFAFYLQLFPFFHFSILVTSVCGTVEGAHYCCLDVVGSSHITNQKRVRTPLGHINFLKLVEEEKKGKRKNLKVFD